MVYPFIYLHFHFFYCIFYTAFSPSEPGTRLPYLHNLIKQYQILFLRLRYIFHFLGKTGCDISVKPIPSGFTDVHSCGYSGFYSQGCVMGKAMLYELIVRNQWMFSHSRRNYSKSIFAQILLYNTHLSDGMVVCRFLLI